MKNVKGLHGLAFLLTAASALSGCSFGGGLKFWSSFGKTYTTQLNNLCAKAEKKTGVKIEHESKGGYPEIRKAMISAMAVGDYPTLATGYPDHLVSYLEHNILVPLDDKVTKSDYYEDYLKENTFYDNSGKGKQRLYGVPFNKSTEVLGYNGVFVDWCAHVQESYGYSGLETLPTTWQEWATEGPKYKEIYDDLVSGKKKIYGKQDAQGHTSNLQDSSGTGLSLLLDFSKVAVGRNYLMSYDANDNAFITLVRQWGAEYTELPDAEAKKPAGKRVGNVKFGNTSNISKVVDMFNFFGGLHTSGVFTVPSLMQAKYGSEPFEKCEVMFMICSSGGLSYNTTKKEYRFEVAPVPYFDDGAGTTRKAVIAQGANLCLTNQGDTAKGAKVMKALTTADIQAEWCTITGYFPGSKSAYESKTYQNFIKSTDYKNPTKVAYRQGAKVNDEVYKAQSWDRFVDPAFVGSAILREKVGLFFKQVLQKFDQGAGTEANIKSIVKGIKSDKDLNLGTVNFEW